MFCLSKYPLMNTKIVSVYQNVNNYEVILTPLEKNFSAPFANFLRRMILSYTIGIGITSIKIKNVNSEFDSIPGVLEDTIQIIMNLKNLVITSKTPISSSPSKLKLTLEGPRRVLANCITTPPGISIINEDFYLFTITDQSFIDIEISIDSGIGYYQSSIESSELGVIPIDSSFCPVGNVSYSISSYPNYEELAFHVQTNGSVDAKDVFFHALNLLYNKIGQIV